MFWKMSLIGALALAATTPSQAADVIGTKVMVADFQKAMDFYAKLGLKVGQKYNAAEQEMQGDNAQGAHLYLVHDAASKRPAGGGFVMLHVDDVAATAKALKDAGYAGVGEPKIAPTYAVLMVKDPDGNDVEVLSTPPKK